MSEIVVRDLPARDQLNVLVVDDDEILAEYIALALEQLGCKTACAFDAASALAMLDDDVDMLLTDWQMPGRDGLDLAREVRNARGLERPIHIAVMTAGQGLEAIRGALAAGVDGFLPKPVDSAQLELAVESARRNMRMHRHLQRRATLLSMAHARTREALQKVRDDLDAAAALHRRLLPSLDERAGARIAHLYVPATIIGGDTFGAADLGEGKLLFFLVDVQGHGVPAALDSFHLHHRLMGLRPSTPEALAKAAQSLNGENVDQGDSSYATMTLGLIDMPAGEGWVVRAGHPPPVIQRNGVIGLLEKGGDMPIGWFAGRSYEAQRFVFPPGSRLAVYSDGLTDALDPQGEAFGTEGLEATMRESQDRPVQDLVDRIGERLALSGTDTRPEDDISLLVIESKES